jgi:hypothetical protein
VTTKTRKRDLRTRVALATYDHVRRYAAAHGITQYAAAERLVLQGLDATNTSAEADAAVKTALDQLAAKTELLAALTERALHSATAGYVYARHGALTNLDGAQRQTLDQTLTQAVDDANQRQRAKALGGDHDAA